MLIGGNRRFVLRGEGGREGIALEGDFDKLQYTHRKVELPRVATWR